mgnify:CR=1 FL=1
MKEQNNSNIAEGAKKLALAAYGLLTIATCAGVWNFCKEPSVIVGSIILLACNGFVIYKLWQKATPKPEKKEENKK